MGPRDVQMDALVREIAELNAVLRGQAERDAPVRRKLFDDRFLGRERSLAFREVNLSAALTDEEFNFPGSVLFADSLSTGTATIKFDSKEAPAFPFKSATGLFMPFRKFFLSCAAQAGGALRLWYGFDVGIIPPNQDIASISTVGTVAAVTPNTLGDLHYFDDTEAATTLITIVAPASNTSGIRVDRACVASSDSATAGGARIMTKSSAPSAWNDADARTLAYWHYGAQGGIAYPINTPVIVPAGQGIYFQQSAAYGCSIILEGEVL